MLGLIFDSRRLPVLLTADESIPDEDSHMLAREPSGRGRAPLSLSPGEEDRFMPLAHGEWTAARTFVRAELRPDERHLSLAIRSYGEIRDGLLRSAPLRQ